MALLILQRARLLLRLKTKVLTEVVDLLKNVFLSNKSSEASISHTQFEEFQ